jgi:hypothetical protein
MKLKEEAKNQVTMVTRTNELVILRSKDENQTGHNICALRFPCLPFVCLSSRYNKLQKIIIEWMNQAVLFTKQLELIIRADGTATYFYTFPKTQMPRGYRVYVLIWYLTLENEHAAPNYDGTSTFYDAEARMMIHRPFG